MEDNMVVSKGLADGESDSVHSDAPAATSNSIIHDLGQQRKQVFLVTFAACAAAASYITMMFVAFPTAIHSIINAEDDCDLGTDQACFVPSERSQLTLTLALTMLRVATFLAGSILGTLSDRFGRRPLLMFALFGYSVASLFFFLGWQTRNVALLVVGAVLLGSASPVLPHGIAYVSDISPAEHVATNLGILQGMGYFAGLLIGAGVNLGIAAVTVDREESLENYNNLFYSLFGLGFILSSLATVITFFALPESLNEKDRSDHLDWKKASPFGFLYLVMRNPYILLLWVAGMFAWASVGAGEAVNGGFWLIRYLITDINEFIVFVVLVWVASAIGAVVCTKFYVSFFGLKGAVHVAAHFAVAVGGIFTFAPNVTISYLTVVASFFGAAVIPLLLTVVMGQVSFAEKGALAGAIRSSEALAKLIGIAAFGSMFAAQIAPFTPDASCIPDDFTPGGNNDCDCGVASCPELSLVNGSIVSALVPTTCSLGQLTPKIVGVGSRYVKVEDADADMRAYPQAMIDAGLIERPDECLGSGFLEGADGFVSVGNRNYCFSEAAAGSFVNAELGCPGFDISQVSLDNIFYSCNGTDVSNVTCSESEEATFLAIGGESYTPYHDEEDMDIYLAILSRVLDPNHEGAVCEEFGDSSTNVCLVGEPIGDFPMIVPFLYFVVFPLITHLAYLIAECCFVKYDGRYWAVDAEGAGEKKDEKMSL